MATEVRSETSGDQQVGSEYQALLDYGRERGYKLDWLQRSETFGIKPEFDDAKGGLLLQNSDTGKFGQTPEFSDNMTGRPRGADPTARTQPRVGNYPVRTKSDVWLRNGAQLYEEAVQRQWSSSTDIPWHTLEELPDEIERAECSSRPSSPRLSSSPATCPASGSPTPRRTTTSRACS